MTLALPARQRRTHPPEFKAELVAVCRQPGTSVSAVALAHGLIALAVAAQSSETRAGVNTAPD